MKKPYLVVHNYGMGGVWAVINARSPQEVITKHPGLIAYDTRPDWMTDKVYQAIAKLTIDIDEEPTGWLRVYLDEIVRERDE